MVIPIFFGKIIGSQLVLDAPTKFARYLRSLAGKEVKITICRKRKKRTENQNRYYWGVVIKMICDKTGNTFESQHFYFRYLFAPRETLKIPQKDGSIKTATMPASSTSLDTMEFMDFIERVKVWAAEFLELDIPNPDEIDYEQTEHFDEIN